MELLKTLDDFRSFAQFYIEQKMPRLNSFLCALKGEPEQFANEGATARERKVARLLKQRFNGVESVRFAGGASIYVSVDLVNGEAISGGYVDGSMTAQQQAESIYHHIHNLLSLNL